MNNDIYDYFEKCNLNSVTDYLLPNRNVSITGKDKNHHLFIKYDKKNRVWRIINDKTVFGKNGIYYSIEFCKKYIDKLNEEVEDGFAFTTPLETLEVAKDLLEIAKSEPYIGIYRKMYQHDYSDWVEDELEKKVKPKSKIKKFIADIFDINKINEYGINKKLQSKQKPWGVLK
jgi:hypothetical protein